MTPSDGFTILSDPMPGGPPNPVEVPTDEPVGVPQPLPDVIDPGIGIPTGPGRTPDPPGTPGSPPSPGIPGGP